MPNTVVTTHTRLVSFGKENFWTQYPEISVSVNGEAIAMFSPSLEEIKGGDSELSVLHLANKADHLREQIEEMIGVASAIHRKYNPPQPFARVMVQQTIEWFVVRERFWKQIAPYFILVALAILILRIVNPMLMPIPLFLLYFLFSHPSYNLLQKIERSANHAKLQQQKKDREVYGFVPPLYVTSSVEVLKDGEDYHPYLTARLKDAEDRELCCFSPNKDDVLHMYPHSLSAEILTQAYTTLESSLSRKKFLDTIHPSL